MAPQNRRAAAMKTLIKNPGRRVGLLYLLLMFPPLRLIYIPAKLIVPGDAAATANNIVSNEMLFRLGNIGRSIHGCGSDLPDTRLLRSIQASQLETGSAYHFGWRCAAVCNLFRECRYRRCGANTRARWWRPVEGARRKCSICLRPATTRSFDDVFSDLHNQVINAAQIFWGVWLFPLAILIWRSRFLPRFVAVWLIVNGFAYVASSITGLLTPRYAASLESIVFPALFGELVLLLWLLIRGIDMERWEAVGGDSTLR